MITVNAFIFHKNKLLLVFHKKLQKWMHVGGHVENDEFFNEALRREIEEEVNLNVEIISNQEKRSVSTSKEFYPQEIPFFIHGIVRDNKRELALDYICRAKEPINFKLQTKELTNYRWIDYHEIDQIDTFPLLKELAKKAFEINTKIN